MKPKDGLVAMLLRSDHDHAATRRYLFEPPSPFMHPLSLATSTKASTAIASTMLCPSPSPVEGQDDRQADAEPQGEGGEC